MSISNKKINVYGFVSASLILLSVVLFLTAFLRTGKSNDALQENANISLGSIISYLRFVCGSKTNNMVAIAFHNFCIAITTYMLSLVSCGILGLVPFCSAFLIAGTVIRSSANIYSIIFVLLELLGIYIAVFYGIYLHKRRRAFDLTLKKTCILSVNLSLVLAVIYLLAAYIECGLISSVMR